MSIENMVTLIFESLKAPAFYFYTSLVAHFRNQTELINLFVLHILSQSLF